MTHDWLADLIAEAKAKPRPRPDDMAWLDELPVLPMSPPPPPAPPSWRPALKYEAGMSDEEYAAWKAKWGDPNPTTALERMFPCGTAWAVMRRDRMEPGMVEAVLEGRVR
jgi:hypothetical protein